jgi:hypothetical protein|tara:strand:- start:1747 stop:2025 length:279 start_codon:yes stop_codon:yes gene_type:complete
MSSGYFEIYLLLCYNFEMRKHINQSKDVFNTLAEKDLSNVQMLNYLDIPHGYPVFDDTGNQVMQLEPSDDFTQFLILSEIVYGKGGISKVSA